jgi:hypothetical protein
MGLGVAIRAFSAGLFNRQLADQIQQVLDGKNTQPADPALPAPDPKPPAQPESAQPTPAQPTPPARSEAITLLSALQREARLVDLIQEDLSAFSDAQVGAAARPCLQQCKSTLDRTLGLHSVSQGPEGSMVDVGADTSPARFQWIGEGTGTSGKLVHQGWQASKVELADWTGDPADANIIAPAQLQR